MTNLNVPVDDDHSKTRKQQRLIKHISKTLQSAMPGSVTQVADFALE